MAAKDTKLMVFAHLGTAWAPCGQLVLTEEADRLLASSFAYGLNYLKRSDALEVAPVNLSLADREAVRAKRLLPANSGPSKVGQQPTKCSFVEASNGNGGSVASGGMKICMVTVLSLFIN